MFPEGRIFEFLIVGAVALMVVGPKDLPILMRKVGRFVAHMRALANEFRASFDDMARQSELDELRREVDAMRSGQTLRTAVGFGPEDTTQAVFDDIHAGLNAGNMSMSPASFSSPFAAEGSAVALPPVVEETPGTTPLVTKVAS